LAGLVAGIRITIVDPRTTNGNRPMAGLDKDTPTPTELVVHKQSRFLEVAFSDGSRHKLSFEFLRVQSPSAEVRGHGPGQETLQVGKRNVGIDVLEPVGNYGVQPRFSDGHATGIFSWDYLYWLCENQEPLWAEYLEQLEQAGASRDPEPSGDPAAADPSAPDLSAVSVTRPRG
jgi:DUF971 family protein